MNRYVVVSGVGAVALAATAALLVREAGVAEEDGGVRVVAGAPTTEADRMPDRGSALPDWRARVPADMRRDYAIAMAQPPAPRAVEESLRGQLRFVGDAAGGPTKLRCGVTTCVLAGEIPQGDRFDATRSLLEGGALADTLATWQWRRGRIAMLPAGSDNAAGFILLIERQDGAAAAR